VAALGIVVVLAGACAVGTHDTTDATTTTVRATTSTVRPHPVVRSSSGCGTPPPVAATQTPTGDVALAFDSGGQQRSYRFGVPTSYRPNHPTPLVFNLHGSGSNAVQQSIYSRLPIKGEERGYLVVTPDAINGSWQMTAQGSDDQFLMGLLDHIEATYCVDLDRVYAAGISLGAWKSAITACTHPDRFAAVALVAVEVAPGNCAMPVVAFHGTADPVVPYGPGTDPGVVVRGANSRLSGAVVNMANWARYSGCSPNKRIEPIGADVEHWIFPGCPPGLGVEFYEIEHGGHTWPGSPVDVARLGRVTRTIDATTIALDWFAAHPLRPSARR
jgi:polyhydroxybutyrate depolymerase